jgi:hypothetical protein
MDSSVSETYGQQDGSAYNGRFGWSRAQRHLGNPGLTGGMEIRFVEFAASVTIIANTLRS